MNHDDLVRDIGWVRRKGVSGTDLSHVPALSEALGQYWPDDEENVLKARLGRFLQEALRLLEDKYTADSLYIALGIGGGMPSSRLRREAFAKRYGGLTAQSVQKNGLESQKFRELADAIVLMVGADSASSGAALQEMARNATVPVVAHRDTSGLAPAESEVVDTHADLPCRGEEPVVVGMAAGVGPEYQSRAFDSEIEKLWADGGDRRVWLRGLPGLGKSYSARRIWHEALAHKGDDRDRLLVWVDSADPDSLIASLNEAADRMPRLRVPVAEYDADARRRRALQLLDILATSTWRWLIVLDNVDDPAALVDAQLIPPGTNSRGRVLITTVSLDPRISRNGRVVLAGLFGTEEAETYLRNLVSPRDGRPSSLADAPAADIRALSQATGHFPLALSIASATIIANDMDIPDWVAVFQGSALMDSAAVVSDAGGYPHLIGRTWQIALEKASEGLPPEVVERSAAVAAVLDPDGHPTWLWTRGTVREWVANGLELEDQFGRPVAIQRLLANGIIELVGGKWKTGQVTIHRLAGRAVRELFPATDLADLAGILIGEWLLYLTENEREARRGLRGNLRHLLAVPGISDYARRAGAALLDFPGRPSRTSLAVGQRNLDVIEQHLREGGVTARAYTAEQFAALGDKATELDRGIEAEANYTKSAENYEQCIRDASSSDEERARWLAQLSGVYDKLGRRGAATDSRSRAATLYEHLLNGNPDVYTRITWVNAAAALYDRLERPEDKSRVLDRNAELLRGGADGLWITGDENSSARSGHARRSAAYARYLESTGRTEEAALEYLRAADLHRSVNPRAARSVELKLARLRIGTQSWHDAEAALNRLTVDNPRDTEALVLHASVLMQLGRRGEADEVLARAANVRDVRELEDDTAERVDATLRWQEHSDPSTQARVVRRLGREAQSRGRWEDAAGLGAAFLSLVRYRADANPGDHEAQLGDAYLELGLRLMMIGRLEDAREHLLSAERVYQTLSDLQPGDAEHVQRLGVATLMLGELGLLLGGSSDQDAGDELSRAIRVLRQLGDVEKEGRGNKLLLAMALLEAGAANLRAGHFEQGEVLTTEAAALTEELVSRDSEDPESGFIHGAALANLGARYLQVDRVQAAEDTLVRAVSILDRLSGRDLRDNMLHVSLAPVPMLLAQTLTTLGMVYLQTDRPLETEDVLTRALPLWEQIVNALESSPDEASGRNTYLRLASAPTRLAHTLFMLAAVQMEAERAEDAEAALVRAIALAGQIAEQNPNDRENQELRVAMIDALADALEEQGRTREAEAARARAEKSGEC